MMTSDPKQQATLTSALPGLPGLRIAEFLPVAPLRESACFRLLCTPAQQRFAAIHVHASCWAFADSLKQTLYPDSDGIYSTELEYYPMRCGDATLRLELQCILADGRSRRFTARTPLPIFGQSPSRQILDNWLRNLAPSVISMRSNPDQPSKTLSIATAQARDHVSDLLTTTPPSTRLAWDIPLEPVVDTSPSPIPQACDRAHLHFLTSMPVRRSNIIIGEQISLGRNGDLLLNCYPQDDAEAQAVFRRISRRHLALRLGTGAQIRDLCSTGGTWLNELPLRPDSPWLTLHDGDVIRIKQHALQLRVHSRPGHWLRLERLGNGAAEEDYFLLWPGTFLPIPIAAGSQTLAALTPLAGGFVLSARDSAVSVNGESQWPGSLHGLQQGDHIQLADTELVYHVGVYDPLDHA